jgi:hypothetical protein
MLSSRSRATALARSRVAAVVGVAMVGSSTRVRTDGFVRASTACWEAAIAETPAKSEAEKLSRTQRDCRAGVAVCARGDRGSDSLWQWH